MKKKAKVTNYTKIDLVTIGAVLTGIYAVGAVCGYQYIRSNVPDLIVLNGLKYSIDYIRGVDVYDKLT